jgi:hypothetical protein
MKSNFFIRLTLFLFATFAGTVFLNAQNTVSGTIKDKTSHEPTIGANVVIKNTTIGAQTDVDGKFTINTAQAFPWTVVISYTGYKSQEIVVNAATDKLDIGLEENETLINEVVVSASRRAEKIQESPAAISVVNAKKLQLDNVGNPVFSLRNTVGLVSDALFLTPYTDMTLYVVRFGYTEKAQLSIINEFYEEHKLSKPTILFNGLKWDDKMKAKYGSSYYTQENHKVKAIA